MQVLCVLCHFGYGRQNPTSNQCALRVRTEMELIKENPNDRLYWAILWFHTHFPAPCWIQKARRLANHRSNTFPALSTSAAVKTHNQHLLSMREYHFYRKRVIKSTGDFLISFINGVVETRALVQRSQKSWHSRTGGKPHFSNPPSKDELFCMYQTENFIRASSQETYYPMMLKSLQYMKTIHHFSS